MQALIWTLLSTIIISCISFAGIFTIFVKDKNLRKIMLFLVAFSAGALMSSAFLHLIPESLESQDINPMPIILAGFASFFVIEKFFFWHHCHDKNCGFNSFGYMNLLGDAVHNFIDGLILAPAFIADFNLGVTTALAIVFHEIPQEIGDFGVLVYSGFKKKKAFLMNFLTALTAVAGGITGYYLSKAVGGFVPYLIPFTAGGFIYISASDLIPELKKEIRPKKALALILTFVMGMLLISAL